MTDGLMQALISGVIGGLWVAGFTLLAERAGERVGGLLGGLPSIVLVTYFFIGFLQGNEAVFGATTSFPAAYAVTGVATFIYVVSRGSVVRRLFFMMGAWLLGQGTIAITGLDDFALALLIYVIFLLALVGYLRQRLASYPAPPAGLAEKARRMGFLPRALLGAVIVGSAVFLSGVAGPLFGAIMAAFPGTILSSILIGERSRGPEFTRLMLLALIYSGALNCVAYALTIRFTVLDLGIFAAMAIAILTTLASVFLTRFSYRLIAGAER